LTIDSYACKTVGYKEQKKNEWKYSAHGGLAHNEGLLSARNKVS